jgi:hypothetical protein
MIYSYLLSHNLSLETKIDFTIYYLLYLDQNVPHPTKIINRLQTYLDVIPSETILSKIEMISRTIPIRHWVKQQSYIADPENDLSFYPLNGIYSLQLSNHLTFRKELFTPEISFYRKIKESIFDLAEQDISGECIDPSLNTLNGSKFVLDHLYKNQKVFSAMNLDREEMDHYLLVDCSSSKTCKWIYMIYSQSKNHLDISGNFGSSIADYICHRKISNQVLNQLTLLYQNRIITLFAILYFLLEYSLDLQLQSESYGKAIQIDIISDIRLNENKYLKSLQSALNGYPVIQQLLDNPVYASRVIHTLAFSDSLTRKMNYFTTPDVYGLNRLYNYNRDLDRQRITMKNYSFLINQIVSNQIKNPKEYLILLEHFEFDEDVLNKIRETIKRNFSQLLSTDFYKQWINQNKDGSGNIDLVVHYTFGKLLRMGAMLEDEFFEILYQMEQDSIELILGLKIYYNLKTDPNQYFAKKELDYSDPNQLPKLNLHENPDNIFELLKNLDYTKKRIPTRDMMKVLNKETPDPGIGRTEEDIQKELDQEMAEFRKSIEEDPTPDEEKEKKYIESGDVQSMLEYMKVQGKKRGFDLNATLDGYMAGFIILQTIISMFDPTQVLADYLVERLLNQGVLGDFIESERKNNKKDGQDFFMDLTTYPSSLVAKLMYENLKSLLERKGVEVNSENMLNQLDTWTEDEKWEVEKTAFLAAKAFLRFINNNNEIRYSGNPQIDISSNIKKIEFQNPKMIVKPGGSGLIEIRKI